MDPGDPLPFDNVPRQKNKRRSSILKPSGIRPVLQDLNPNVVKVTPPPIVTLNTEKRKSRRVSFSRTQQVKEFQPGQNNLTVWNDTYEEEKSNASGNSTGVNSTQSNNTTQNTNSTTTTGPSASRLKQLQAGQLTTLSPSKGLPLNISIPQQASPNKYLPSHTVDTGDFLQSLAGQQKKQSVDSSNFLASLGAERDRKDSEDSNVEHDSSFVKMLNKISDVDSAATGSQTLLGEVDMSHTMMDVSMFQHGNSEDTTAELDTMGFLAGLTSSPPEEGMNTTLGGNPTNRMKGLEHLLNEEVGMDITMAPNRTCVGGGMDMTLMGGGMDVTLGPNKTVMGGGMDVTLGPNKTLMGGMMDDTLEPNKTVMGGGMDVTLAPNKTQMGGGMDVSNDKNKAVMERGMDATIASNKTVMGGGMDVTCVPQKTYVGDGLEMPNLCSGEDHNMSQGQDSVFDNSMMSEYKAALAGQQTQIRPNTADLIAALANPTTHHPTAEELPDSLPASANSSMDYGATATVKFSVLALANNTLVLPRKESEEDDDDGMTKCPVQFFSYDPSKPVIEHGGYQNRTTSADADMEITEALSGNIAPIEMKQVNQEIESNSVGMVKSKVAQVIIEMPKVGPADLEMTKAGTTDMELTKLGAVDLAMTNKHNADLEITKAGNTDMVKTKAGNASEEMEMSIAAGSKTAVVHSQSVYETSSLSVFSPISGPQNSSVSVSSYQSRSGEKEPGSANNGSTAMDITRHVDEMDIAETLVEKSSITLNRSSLPKKDNDGPEYTDDSGWETIHNTLNLPPSNEPSCTPPITGKFKSQGELLREKFPSPISEDPSPDRTEMVGMMPQFNNSVWDGDLTSFFPRGESTRAISLPIPPVSRKLAPAVPQISNLDQEKIPTFEVGDITSFLPGGESTRAIKFPIPTVIKLKTQCQVESPLVSTTANVNPSLEVGDVTSFLPRGESTRAINFPIPPVTKSTLSYDRSPVPLVSNDNVDILKNPTLEVGDVTSFLPHRESTRAIHLPFLLSNPLKPLASPSDNLDPTSCVDHVLSPGPAPSADISLNLAGPPVALHSGSLYLPLVHQSQRQYCLDVTTPEEEQARCDVSLEMAGPPVAPHSGSLHLPLAHQSQQQSCLNVTTPEEEQAKCDQSPKKDKMCELLSAQTLQVHDLQESCMDVTTPEIQQQRDLSGQVPSNEDQRVAGLGDSILPDVEITAAPVSSCYEMDGVCHQHDDCNLLDKRSPSVKRGAEETSGDQMMIEAKKQRLSCDSTITSDIERDLEGSYVQKITHTDSLSRSLSVKERLQNLSCVKSNLTEAGESNLITMSNVGHGALGVGLEKCNEVNYGIVNAGNTSKDISYEGHDPSKNGGSPVPALSSLSFKDFSQRLLPPAVRSAEEKIRVQDQSGHPVSKLIHDEQKTTIHNREQVEMKNDKDQDVMNIEKKIIYENNKEKMINEEEQPILLTTFSDLESQQSSVECPNNPEAAPADSSEHESTNLNNISDNSVDKHIRSNYPLETSDLILTAASSEQKVVLISNASNCLSFKSVTIPLLGTLQILNNSKQEVEGYKVDDNEMKVDDKQKHEVNSDPMACNLEAQTKDLTFEENSKFTNIEEVKNFNVSEVEEVQETSESIRGAQDKIKTNNDGKFSNDYEMVDTEGGNYKMTNLVSQISTKFNPEELTVFSDLVSRQVSSETPDSARWRLMEHCMVSNIAVFSWLENSMVLVLHLGEKLKPKKSRKSLGRPIGHWTVSKLYLDSVHRDETVDDPIDEVFDAAHFSVIRKFPESTLRAQCPNTYSLSSLLKSITAYVIPAHSFFTSLNYTRHNFYPFSVANNIVTVGFVSTVLGQAFDIQVDFSAGFGSAPSTFSIVTTIGPVNMEVVTKLVTGVNPGPDYIKDVTIRVEQYLKEKERRLMQGKK